MDLSFSRMRERKAAGGTPAGFVDLSVMLAAASAWQAASPTKRAVASMQEQSGAEDRVGALAWIFAPRSGAAISLSCLAGSFNKLISEHLMVGQGS